MATKRYGVVDEYGTISKIASKKRIAQFHETNMAIARFSRFIRANTIPTAHRFRKSLAEFMLRVTKLAPLLICQLFGHKSVDMTLRYLKHNNLIIREMRTYNADRFRSGAALMAVSFTRGAAGGRMVERIYNAVIARDEFHGLTEPEMEVALARWLMSRVVNQDLIILLTPLSLCCRSTTANDIPLCRRQQPPNSYDSVLPDPSSCAGAKCDWAMVTFEQAEGLGAAISFYKNVLESAKQSLFRGTHLLAYATDFIETYDPILDKIKKVPTGELRGVIEHLKGIIKEGAAA